MYVEGIQRGSRADMRPAQQQTEYGSGRESNDGEEPQRPHPSELDVTPVAGSSPQFTAPLCCAWHAFQWIARGAHSGGLDRSHQGRYCRTWTQCGRWQPSGVNTSPNMHRYNEVSQPFARLSVATRLASQIAGGRASMLQIFHVMALVLVRTRTVCANP